ncbi:hypothetical protein BGZ51_000424 [Haplosporangium sp. Z 767]|nr:hypothetical protein BGZ51_000424 [Haplosporangium sp. Z 767]KAF9196738.1 hypothetical protein BGZ50_007902 [Haplosporangium sp. Z 11]
MASLSLTTDLTLRVESPLLSTVAPDNTKEIRSPASDGSCWIVTMTRADDVVTVTTTWSRGNSNRRPEGDNYRKLFIVPHKKPKAATVVVDATAINNGHPVHGTVNIKKVLYDKKYRFDIIVSTCSTMPESLLMAAEANKDMAINRQTMQALLKDTSSIDTCFVFPGDKASANIGLGAHRCILSQHRRFAEVIQRAVIDMTSFNLYKDDKGDKVDKRCKGDKNDKDDDETAAPSIDGAGTFDKAGFEPEVVVIQVNNFSFATFCALLLYIYTGEIKLSIDASQFAISKTASSLMFYDDCGNPRGPLAWNPLKGDSPWKLRDVEWDDLLIAAENYGITGLREHCQEEVSEAINKSNVIKTLFKVGTQCDEIKQEALNFIACNMESLFLDNEDKDPFLSYRSHPSYHELLIELIRIKAKTK